ncbi:MAG: shikimate kinase [Flavobacteriaceae bacterium]|nr:shikimate kinase [Flavobacteriaceae bacterium]
MEISLMGYMGSGKSHVGKILAKRLGVDFYDLDDLIELDNNSSIQEIFSSKGEIYFRKNENKILADFLSSKSEYVLATGGGTPVFYDNLDLLKKHSTTIYLYLSPVHLAERLKLEKLHRPLIAHVNDENLTEFVAKHLFERNIFYQQAHYIVPAAVRSAEVICNEIIDKIISQNHQNLT